MKNLFIWYPKCSTCQKAKKWLQDNKIAFEEQNAVEIKKFLNTSGLKYKELNLKEKLPDMTEEEKIELLASNGMLIKRPLLISDTKVLVGFKEKEWREMI